MVAGGGRPTPGREAERISDEMAVHVVLGAEDCPPDIVHTHLKGSEMPRASRAPRAHSVQHSHFTSGPREGESPEEGHTGGKVMTRLGSSDSENKSMSIPVNNYKKTVLSLNSPRRNCI